VSSGDNIIVIGGGARIGARRLPYQRGNIALGLEGIYR
jgi:hypothetical protein